VARLSQLAIDQCVAELRAACRRPIDPEALAVVIGWLRPNFEEILDHPDGAMRWLDHGRRMRENGRYLGALADFFGHQHDVAVVGTTELTRAFAMVRDACTVGAERRADAMRTTAAARSF
jgi:hypothetical protein